jgi:hypothetical protein
MEIEKKWSSSFEMIRPLAQEEGVIHITLIWFCFPSFFPIPSRVLLLPVSRIQEANSQEIHQFFVNKNFWILVKNFLKFLFLFLLILR